MNLTDESFYYFLEYIYDALEKPQKWKEFYEELATAVRADAIHVLGIGKRHDTLSYSDGANLQPEGELAYIQEYRFIDPRSSLVFGKALMEWVHCHQAFDDDYVRESRFYQEYLIPNGQRYMSACKLVDNEDAILIFSTLRTPENGPMPQKACAFLKRLMPHLSRAFRLSDRNFIYSTQGLVGHMVINRMQQPVILITPTAEVIQTNESAARLLNSISLVKIENGKLRLPDPFLNELLNQCNTMEEQLKARKSNELSTENHFRSIQIVSKTEDGVAEGALYIFFTMLTPQHVMGTFGLRPVIMLCFYHPDAIQPVEPSLLYAAFGLTPAESKIACLLAEGLSIKQIAGMLGTRRDTVRKQLGAVYQKTSTRRQSELVRLLLLLPQKITSD